MILDQKPKAIYEKALTFRSDVQLGITNIEIAETDINLAKSSLKPSLSAFIGYFLFVKCGMLILVNQDTESTDESILINSQFIELQESPEQLKGGIQPERIICIGEHDIAGKLNPGDRVKANGVLFIRSQRKGGKDTPVFDIFLRIHSLERQNVPLEEISITEDEELEIKELANRSDIYDLFSGSIAPSIFGMPRVKESLMLQLFGGVARLNPDGTRNRGDIHILLMGDPGVAVSYTHLTLPTILLV